MRRYGRSTRGLGTLSAAGLCCLLAAGTAFAADGDLDPTFGTGGVVRTSLGSNSAWTDVAVQPDGKIVTVGTTIETSGAFTAARYFPDGSLDTTFDGDGTALTPIGAGSAFAQAVVALPDGKILAGGYTTIPNPVYSQNGNNTVPPNFHKFALVRYNANGSLDGTFGTGGIVLTDLGSCGVAQLHGLAVAADGDIVAVGYASDDVCNFAQNVQPFYTFAVARYNAAGVLDPSFDGDGKLLDKVGEGGFERANAVVLDEATIVVAGTSRTDDQLSQTTVVRYLANGDRDTTFAQGGVRAIAIGAEGSDGSGLALTGGRYAVSATSYGPDDKPRYAAARLEADGDLDPSFGSNGVVEVPFGDRDVQTSGVAVAPDGRVLIVGSVVDFSEEERPRADVGIVRLTPTGALDPTFGQQGSVVTTVDAIAIATSLALQKDGKILVVGGVGDSLGGLNSLVLRYGVPDASADTSTGPVAEAGNPREICGPLTTRPSC